MSGDNLKLADIHLRGQDQSMRNIETKSSTLLTITLALFSVSFTVLSKAIGILQEALANEHKIKIGISIFILILFGIYTILAVGGIHKLIRVIAPKIVSKSKSAKKSIIFFEDIKETNTEEYKKMWHNISETEIMDELADRIYNTAFVISDKYKKINSAVNLLEIAGLIAILFILMVSFI